ncbi:MULTISPECIES: GmrSD restriction endonuclease domain-containing protein [unclassified Paenibacillus]|uniref:GmrSD restriction endonuclease domain-containing protein n=1 Tax=unclassified Paenibacillus TaxID=185978 RepID=UPI001AE8990E|nr:DUF262 domain-containing protein [Paenibacillus sp. PvR133]MBP1173863.1 uncharacterized protein with ParB-like and HNH nuclease domain [Paenibacillus sp. PvR133]
MSLQEEIDNKAKEIQADGYPMSIGELANMYRDGELQVNPEFQRFFRWSDSQKTKLIESILLGIPIPPIFVSHGEKGIWDVIDGLQRLSTIFEFMGLLKSPEDTLKPASKLLGTKFLPSLENKMWDNPDDLENSFTQELRIDFKRSKFDIKIIKKTSDKDAKYELFQRINTGGSKLSDQEIRNCLLIMVNRSFYLWAAELVKHQSFINCIPLSEKQQLEQFNMEILMRYLVIRHADLNKIKGNEDIGEFISEEIIGIAENKSIDLQKETTIFHKTFDYLDRILSDDAFRKFDDEKMKFKGAFSMPAFEVIIAGVSENINEITTKPPEETIQTIKNIYKSPQYLSVTTRGGARPITRLKDLATLSKGVFMNG